MANAGATEIANGETTNALEKTQVGFKCNKKEISLGSNVAATSGRLQGHSEMDRTCCSHLRHSCIFIPAVLAYKFLLPQRSPRENRNGNEATLHQAHSPG